MKISIKTSKFILSVFITITIVINGFTCFASSPPLIGDADTDGKVNIKDATLIQKHIAGIVTLSDEGYKFADTNNDGKVNVKDATLIQKFIAGIVTEFPTTTTTTIISLSEIPPYDTFPYYIVNNNLPFLQIQKRALLILLKPTVH